ncbi:ATP phosphoribosyltransferase [Zancudomyces culisetae]|uniref:ATP phosphoribosyltransferase n=1 Tax=Zancudomyces culisetae TaxID=1213189 RepID=A0A1R1PIH4_ZANCU|nr:ATP phosphoribosyltransferase [Zancudomyces culisetae]|eukprot:OMH80784.1 ATP phosphoribosyltransferase [Zancudomyces culisetae]
MEIIENNGRLLFAVPKKGRLYENCLALLEKIGIDFKRKARHDIALVSNLPIALLFLPAADIAKYVAEGDVDMGITGQDIISETECQDLIEELLPLGFGKCKLQVQVPSKSGITSAEELVGKRIVTSFPALTQKYFDELESKTRAETPQEQQGTPQQQKRNTKVKYVNGSVEIACSLGLADGIVDLVESGETMRAAGLQVAGTVLQSQAVLFCRKNKRYPELVEKLKSRIEGVLTARKYVLCQYNILRNNTEQAIKITPGRKAPSIMPLDKPDWVAINAMVEKAVLAETMDQLTQLGATDILVLAIDNCRV